MNIDIANWIIQAVGLVANGMADRLEKGDVIVYKCGKIVRIDVKGDLQDAEIH